MSTYYAQSPVPPPPPGTYRPQTQMPYIQTQPIKANDCMQNGCQQQAECMGGSGNTSGTYGEDCDCCNL